MARSDFIHGLLAGRDSALHTKHKMYLDVVANGLPLLPQKPHWLEIPELTRELECFHIHVLSIVDVVVSKLRRFHANDVRDIQAMIDLDLVPHGTLAERFRAAIDWHIHSALASEVRRCIANFHRVERDLLFVEETGFELPEWIDN